VDRKNPIVARHTATRPHKPPFGMETEAARFQYGYRVYALVECGVEGLE